MKKQKQSGYVLVIALIGLVAMTIAAALLIRSTSSVNQIAGNIAMRQSGEQLASIGFEMAMSSLNGAIKTAGVEKTWTSTSAGGRYYPRELYSQEVALASNLNVGAINTNCRYSVNDGYGASVPPGIPTCIAEPDANGSGAVASWTGIDWFSSDFEPAIGGNIPDGYSVRYVIDRQCAVQSADKSDWNPGETAAITPPKGDNFAAVRKFCRVAETTSKGRRVSEEALDRLRLGEKELQTPQTYYRITVQVTGPRAMVHFAQAVVLL